MIQINTLQKCITVFTLTFLVLGCQSNKSSQGDWPVYDITTLLEISDVVIYGKVEDIYSKKIDNMDFRISEVKILDQFLDEEYTLQNEMILMAQSTNFLKKGDRYILFLTKNNPDEPYYYQVDAQSIIKEENNRFRPSMEGFTGTYKIEELADELQKMNKEADLKGAVQFGSAFLFLYFY